jgi:DNA-directed RNA polymerase specialized sigma24 family protein
MTIPAEGPDSDSDLLAAVRSGDTAAYGTLYERHRGAARQLAYGLAHDPADAEDLVAETFAKVFASLRAGRGPLVAFRAYLNTTMRHVCYHRARRDRRLEFTDDLTRYDEVLWQTAVEGNSPAEVAGMLGMTPNAVAVLAHRAREGLRSLYLQQHVAVADHPECRWAGDRLGGHLRGRLAARDAGRMRAHLGWCGECRGRFAEISEIDGLRHRPYRQRARLRLANENCGP